MKGESYPLGVAPGTNIIRLFVPFLVSVYDLVDSVHPAIREAIFLCHIYYGV
jgi:hypothetical protein